MPNIYTKQEVLKMIEKAFWDGVEEGQTSQDYSGDSFSAKDYLNTD